MKAITYPLDLYFVKDDSGRFHWYRTDPMRSRSKEDEEVDLNEALATFYGEGSELNPVKVRFCGAQMNRCTPFDSVSALAILRSRQNRHVEDREGSLVLLFSSSNEENPDFPFRGKVVDSEGEVFAIRSYSLTGECSDGVAGHGLILVRNERTETRTSEYDPGRNVNEQTK